MQSATLSWRDLRFFKTAASRTSVLSHDCAMPAAPSLSSEGGVALAQQDFRCVPLTVFRLHRNCDVSLYSQSACQGAPVLYRAPCIPVTDDDIAQLIERGHHALYVSAAEYEEFNQALTQTLQENLGNESFSREERFSVLQSTMALEIDLAFHMIKCDRFVALTHGIAKQITSLLSAQEVMPSALFSMLQHDYYTYNHIMNVAAYATLLGDRLGYSDPEVREQIAVGALLHDIGKRFIPAKVLNKRGKLSDEDWEMIRLHPQRGYEDLCDRDDLNRGQLMMVYSHHERLDGTGYPVGMVKDEIHPWAKMLAVVDVFDAITSARPYRLPMSVPEALELLNRNAGTHFDREMVTCWTALMQSR
jgi:HD-GYP domain-containing protein (c-di-GMP phosphodiesterase class II)